MSNLIPPENQTGLLRVTPDVSDGEFNRLLDELSADLVLPRQANDLSRADIYLEHLPEGEKAT